MKLKGIWVLICLSFFSLIGCSTNQNQTKDFSIGSVTDIDVTADSYQLIFRASTDNKIHVKYAANNNNTVELQDTHLLISQKKTKKSFFDNFSFGKEGEIIIYIPTEYGNTLTLNNGSGDLSMDSLSLSSLDVNNKSGYLTLKNISATDSNLTSTSGDLTLKNCDINDLKIESSSGYITLNNTTSSIINAESGSGEIKIIDFNENKQTSISNSSGDISISYATTPSNLSFNIATNSDDITTRLSDSNYEIDTPSCKKGAIGAGSNTLSISSDSGTIIVK
ncbi:DUF4097 family beta strand repeat-containing protein [Anaerosporobacter sp.]|uniref:DUF4097 family beta strand repeat-containing protein n=1 Tax=Anaerosporobacter sp. TaxID=1872529 RepID=UPI00286EE9DD|nr:DUF4097 family beta strand repeat-containing protein [Anaerosporobacter sp.]